MRPGFMTSVCPQETLAQLIGTARRHGYQGIEFRTEWSHAHGVELDAPSGAIGQARQLLADGGIAASCVATSVRFNSVDPSEHLPQRETLRRYVELAAELGAPYIRTFSDKLPDDDETRDRVLGLAAESYAAADEWAGQHGVLVLVETHTNMRGDYARRIQDAAGAQHLGVLWHIGHHVSRGQSVDEAYLHIGGLVRHVHFSVAGQDVTDADNVRMFALLARDGFPGFISVEIINPEDSEATLELHATKFEQFAVAARGEW